MGKRYIYQKMSIIDVKLIVITCIVWVFVLPHYSSAQQRKVGSEVDLDFPSRMIRMDSLGRRIDKQSGFILSYNASVIDPGKILAVPKLHIKLVDLLAYLEKRYYLRSEILGNHIIIRTEQTRKKSVLPSKKRERAAMPDARYVPRSLEININRETRQSKKIIIADNRAISPITQINSIPKASYQEIKTGAENDRALVRASPKWQLKIARAARQKQKRDLNLGIAVQKKKENNPKKGFAAAVGLVSDEVFYIQPTLEAGMPWLFSLLSWRTSFNTSGMVYGIGTQFRFADHWAIALTAKTGPLLKKFEWMDTDSTIGKIRIKGNMSQVSVLATKGIGRLTVRFGPTVNFLKSSYSFSGDNQPTRNQLDSVYHLIRPLYTIGNAYSHEDKENRKMWIGLQVGLFYQLK